jgi:hypothetical protein
MSHARFLPAEMYAAGFFHHPRLPSLLLEHSEALRVKINCERILYKRQRGRAFYKGRPRWPVPWPREASAQDDAVTARAAALAVAARSPRRDRSRHGGCSGMRAIQGQRITLPGPLVKCAQLRCAPVEVCTGGAAPGEGEHHKGRCRLLRRRHTVTPVQSRRYIPDAGLYQRALKGPYIL